MDKKEVLKAVRVISQYCKESSCRDCMLIDCCMEGNPSCWVRFVEEDEDE